MGWIHLLSNRVASCQITLTLTDTNNGNLSALPPHSLKHLCYTKPWEGFMPRPATAPQTCWMEVPASSTHTWGAQRVLCTSCPPPQGHVPPTCLGQAWPCSWRPGVAPLAPHLCTPRPLSQLCCQSGWELFAPLEPWPLPTPPGTLGTLTLVQAMCHVGSTPSAVSTLAQGGTGGFPPSYM